MDLELPADVLRWLDGKAAMLQRDRSFALVWALREAIEAERQERTHRYTVAPPGDSNPMWSALLSQQRVRIDGH